MQTLCLYLFVSGIVFDVFVMFVVVFDVLWRKCDLRINMIEMTIFFIFTLEKVRKKNRFNKIL